MAKKKESKIIPSEFPVITQYESAFVSSWNKNTAKMMIDVLKYLSKETANSIKNGIKI